VKRPFLMPVLAGLLDGETGAELVGTTLLELSQAEQDFTFELAPGLTKPPVLSVLRGFSAPVIRSESACFCATFHAEIDRFAKTCSGQTYCREIAQKRLVRFLSDSEVIGQSVDDLAFLMEYDTDSFCRWDASQELATRAVLTMLGVIPPGSNSSNPAEAFIAAASVRKTRLFASHLYIKTFIFLPRQARDKHRHSTQNKEWRFPYRLHSSPCPTRRLRRTSPSSHTPSPCPRCEETPF
jgi:hypothetical protein